MTTPPSFIPKNFFNLLCYGSALLLLGYVCSAGNSAIINEIISYFGHEDGAEETELPSWLTILAFILATTNALPLVLAMLNPGARTQSSECIDEVETQVVNPYWEKAKSLGKLLLIGAPPGLLDSAGTIKHGIPVACCAGIIAASGYTRLLGPDCVAKENCLVLFKNLPSTHKRTMLLTAASIILGTLSEIFISTDIFFTAIGNFNPLMRNIIIGAITLLTTGFICNTEIRSILLQGVEDHAYLPKSTISKILLLLPSALSGLFATVGIAKLFKLIFPELSLIARGIIFAISGCAILLPNAKGFYHTTLPAVDSATNSVGKLYHKCIRSTFFGRANLESVTLLSHDNVDSSAGMELRKQ